MALNKTGRSKSGFLDKVLNRLNRLDPEGLQSVVQRLQRERALLGTLFNTIEDGIVVLDHSGKVAYLNQSAAQILSVPLEATLNQPLSRVLPELDASLLRPTTQGRVVRCELEIQIPRLRFLRLYAAPIEEDPGARVVLVLHDATELRHTTREAVEAERGHALTLLAASVAHEIGNPLNALHIHLQLMDREVRKLQGRSTTDPGPVADHGGASLLLSKPRRRNTTDPGPIAERLERYLEVAKGEVTRLDYIITDFLQAVRPSAPRLRDGSVNDVVDEALRLLGPELENRGLHIVTRVGRGIPEVRLDPAQIKQALLNLVKNAMQSMTKGGTLTLSTGTTPDDVWLAVADTGSGIAADQLNRLFEPLYTTKRRGSGLGLMVVQRIVRDHGGRIDVESEVGRGTTFRIRLPRQKLIALEFPSPSPMPSPSPSPAAPESPRQP